MQKLLTLSALLIAATSLQACKEELPYYKRKATTPSPLVQVDEAQRWVLIKEAGGGWHGGCSSLYENPDAPENTAFIEVCKKWEIDATEYINNAGVPIERAHLRDPSLREWIDQYSKKIIECRKNHRGFGSKAREEQDKCDPWLYKKVNSDNTAIEGDMDFTPLKFERNN